MGVIFHGWEDIQSAGNPADPYILIVKIRSWKTARRWKIYSTRKTQSVIFWRSGVLAWRMQLHLPINICARSWLRHCTLSLALPPPRRDKHTNIDNHPTESVEKESQRTLVKVICLKPSLRYETARLVQPWLGKQLVPFPLSSDRAVGLFSPSYCVIAYLHNRRIQLLICSNQLFFLWNDQNEGSWC